MRENLFRGKHIHAFTQNKHLDGIWVYGYLCDENYINSLKLKGEFLVDPKSVCQYTELPEKNGKKIFEGDIVKQDDDIGIVKFGKYDNGFHYGFYIEWSTDTMLRPELAFWNSRIEVIGNIFDNPELLEVAE